MSDHDASGKMADQTARLPSLDGWRALSILMVLGLHAWRLGRFPEKAPAIYRWIFDGDTGVRFFFIISGFLITWLMIAEHSRTGAVSLKNFYIRRCFRILPVYLAFMGVLLMLQCFTAYSQSRGAWMANLTFTTNFATVPWPSQHLWSLAVEEQFYLLWPFLFVSLGLSSDLKVACRALSVPIVIAPIFRLLEYKHYYPSGLAILFSHGSFFRYFDSLAIGCGCAILLARCSHAVRARLDKSRAWVPLLAVGLIMLPNFFIPLALPTSLVQVSAYTLQASGFGLLLMQSVCFPRLMCYRWLNWPVIKHIGVLSYSIYIWQQIFFTNPMDFGLKDAWWLDFPGALIMALGAAHVSYYGLEQPFLKLRARFRGKVPPSQASASSAAGQTRGSGVDVGLGAAP